MDNQHKFISLEDYSPITIQTDPEKQKEIIKELQKLQEQLQNAKQPIDNVYRLPNWEQFKRNKRDDKVVIIEKSGENKWWTQGYIGVLQFQDVTIFIGSRFDGANEGKYFFTNYILSKALKVKGLLFPDMQPFVGKERLLEQLLAIVFVNQIKVAQKHGLFRMYQSFERNDAKVRGKIDVTRHMNANPMFNGKIAYSYREYTADNDVNRIIFTAFSMLEKKYKAFMKGLLNSNRSVKDCMRQLGNIVQPVSRQELQKLLKQKNQKIHHSVYMDWEAVRKTAVMILQHMGVNIAQSDKSVISGILIDMTEMWELYLESILEEVGKADDLRLKAQNSYSVLYNGGFGRRSFRPDFCWRRKDKVVFIADAKYKNSWEKVAKRELTDSARKAAWNEPEFNVREDVFQVMSYMYTLSCRHGAIICPIKVPGEIMSVDESSVNIYYCDYDVRGKKGGDKFHLFALAIPQNCKEYTDFKAQMELSENNLRQTFLHAISSN